MGLGRARKSFGANMNPILLRTQIVSDENVIGTLHCCIYFSVVLLLRACGHFVILHCVYVYIPHFLFSTDHTAVQEEKCFFSVAFWRRRRSLTKDDATAREQRGKVKAER